MNVFLVRILFAVSAAYDIILGVAFIGFGPKIFEWAEVDGPGHWGYVKFSAGLLVIFGLMFLNVALFPHKNRNLVCYGILLKLGYVSMASYYWATSGIAWIFKPFIFIDALMFLLFIAAWRVLHPKTG
jgi:hypothetical protein